MLCVGKIRATGTGATAWLVAVTWALLGSGCGGHVSLETGGSAGSGAGGAGGATTSTSTTSTTDTIPTGTTTTSTTITSTTTTPMSGDYLGLSCTSDPECGPGGHCVKAGDNDPLFGGGPAGGYCTATCSSDSDCGGFANTCLLADPNGPGECLLGCVFGDPPLMTLNDPLDPSKCRAREDLRCQELQDGSNVCLPSCGSDAQCPGRYCDQRLSVCVDAPSAGTALGSKCDPQAMTNTCAGFCVGISGGASMCTSPCAMGGEVPNPDECGGAGVCIYSPSGTGVGDLGYCAQTCEKQDQCQTPTFFCFDIGLPTAGACLASSACQTDSDCQNLPNATCSATNLGSFCLSPTYPLGALAP